MLPLPSLQLFCVLGIIVGAAMYRYRLIDEPYSLGLLMINLFGLVILSIVAMYSIATEAGAFAPKQLIWLVLSLLPVIAMGVLIWQSLRVPAIHDISTNTLSPPEFLAAKNLRKRFHHKVDYSPEMAIQQAIAYPDIVTQRFSSNIKTVFNNALEVSEELGWQLSQVDLEQGRIEAYAVTPLLGFVDDIVIQVQQVNGETLVDVRSQSRIGKSDLGANAKRIRVFQAVFTSKMQ